MRVHLIVTAAGAGRRLGRDKIWLPLKGKPLILHTLDLFSNLPDVASRVVTLTPKALEEEWPALPGRVHLQWKAVVGGASRQESVMRGVNALTSPGGGDLVLVHDGARPSLSRDDLTHLIEEARTHGSAVALTPVNDTLKRLEGVVISKTVDRTNLYRALTPQIFLHKDLSTAFSVHADHLDDFTDESSIMETMGEKIHGVVLAHPNPKLTTPQDLPLLKALLTWVAEESRDDHDKKRS